MTEYVKTEYGIEECVLGTHAEFSMKIDGKECTTPIKKFKVNTEIDSRKKYAIPPSEKFVEYEESDMDWLIYFGFAPEVGIQKSVDRPRSVVLNYDGPVSCNFSKEYVDEYYCD